MEENSPFNSSPQKGENKPKKRYGAIRMEIREPPVFEFHEGIELPTGEGPLGPRAVILPWIDLPSSIKLSEKDEKVIALVKQIVSNTELHEPLTVERIAREIYPENSTETKTSAKRKTAVYLGNLHKKLSVKTTPELAFLKSVFRCVNFRRLLNLFPFPQMSYCPKTKKS